MPLTPSEIKERYNGRWKFFQYLSGTGMSIYNTYHYGMGRDVYAKIFECLLRREGIAVERDAELPMYWYDDKLDGTYNVDMLVNGNVIVDIYSIDRIDNEQRQILKSRMKLTHTHYGIVCNFDRNMFYSEWYILDKQTGIIDRIKLM